jgi:uncharacterized membrane protein
MVLLYVGAGVNHFVHPGTYKKIMPPWIPAPALMVALSGVFEIVLALLLLPEKTRIYAAWGLMALLIAVFPANIQMAINYWQRNNAYLWVAIIRIPVQAVLIWWALQYTK